MEFNATFFVTAISFILFTFIMNKIFYAPLSKVIDEREEFIKGAVNDAKNSETQADVLRKNKEAKLNETNEKSRLIITEAADEANANSEALTDEAKRQAQIKAEEARNCLLSQTEAAQAELKLKVKDLAETIASKVLQAETHIDNVNSELIDRILV